MGMGISGGEEGARKGPSLMPGGWCTHSFGGDMGINGCRDTDYSCGESILCVYAGWGVLLSSKEQLFLL
jgi:hypothetical protein